MPSPIDILPVEIFEYVVASLCINDVVLLMRVSKAYHNFLEPPLWTRIEMHRVFFHVQNTHNRLRGEEAQSRQDLPYDQGPDWDGVDTELDVTAHRRAEQFLRTFSTHEKWGKGLSEARRSYLGSLIRWLCLPINLGLPYEHPADVDPWNSFTSFVNLEYLEISGFWVPPSTSAPFLAPDHGLAKLRTLKLRGYFPKEFVQWLLKEPANIKQLQLGIMDAPVGSSNVGPHEWINPPPPENRRPANMEGMSGEEIAEWEGVEDLEQESVGPRALACLTPDIMSRLTNLKVLYLCKPANGDQLDDDFIYFSEP